MILQKEYQMSREKNGKVIHIWTIRKRKNWEDAKDAKV